ncbi:MAG: DNA polymerase III subunit beta [Clostridia bacterium]|nr:DNA polymerase III subunit beta [Clostridia bacterium]
MKIICNSAELSKAAANVQRTVSNKSTIPALEGILIEAGEGKVTLTGYDLEVGSIIVIDAEVKESGKIILAAKNFCDIMRMLPDDSVLLESDDRNICKIKSGETDYSLIGTSADEYPELPTLSKFSPVKMNLNLLKDMIKRTVFSVSTGERNPVHSGVKFEIEEKNIVLVAVDGARLAIRREIIEREDENILNFVVPSKTLNEILKLNADEEAEIEILVGDRHLIFRMDNYEIVSRLLEGNFINYKSAIPMTSSTQVVANTRRLIECIERTSLIITDRSSPVRLVVEDGTMKFSSVTAIGTATDKMPAEIEGNKVEVGFNNRFLIDALKATEQEEIRMEFGSSNQPIIIKPFEGDSFFYLVLPVRI